MAWIGPAVVGGMSLLGGAVGNDQMQKYYSQGMGALDEAKQGALGALGNQFQTPGYQGMFSGYNFNPQTNTMQTQMNPMLSGLAGQAGQNASGFLSQAGSYDPWQTTQTQFQRMNDIMQPYWNQDVRNMDALLMSQGRKGASSYGQSPEMTGLFNSQNEARQKMLTDAWMQGQQTQGNLMNMATQNMGMLPQIQNMGLAPMQYMAPYAQQMQDWMANRANVYTGYGSNVANMTSGMAGGTGGMIGGIAQGLGSALGGIF
jgi:hypothetical protein